MRRTALAGLALSIGGAIGIIATELIGTAYADRPSERDYLIAISSGSPLILASATAVHSGAHASHAGLACDRVLRLPGIDVGYLCKRSAH